MNSDNLDLNEHSFENQADKFEPFETSEMEILQFLALQMENVIAPTLQKYGLYYYIQATNEIADLVIKNTSIWSSMKRKEL